MFIAGLGVTFFGLIIGIITYRILRQATGASGYSNLIAIVEVVGSAAVVTFLRSDVLFGWYAIGLVIGLFGYFTVGLRLFGKQEMQAWRIPPIPSTSVPVNAHGEEES